MEGFNAGVKRVNLLACMYFIACTVSSICGWVVEVCCIHVDGMLEGCSHELAIVLYLSV
jgi:hypothetical protein